MYGQEKYLLLQKKQKNKQQKKQITFPNPLRWLVGLKLIWLEQQQK